MSSEPGFNLSSRLPIDGLLLSLLAPAITMTVVVIPFGFLFKFGQLGSLVEVVPAGSTANYYWVMFLYVPILATLGFATSMVWAGRVVATVWHIGSSDLDAAMLHPDGASPEQKLVTGPPPPIKPQRRSMGNSFKFETAVLKVMESEKRASVKAMAEEDIQLQEPEEDKGDATTLKPRLSVGDSFKLQSVARKVMEKSKVEASQKAKLALALVRRTSCVEFAQLLLLVVYILLALVTGNVAVPSNPLWDAAVLPWAIGCSVFGLVILCFYAFTLRNLRTTMVKREGKQTVEYVAAFLGRISVCLLMQHFCFFYVGVAATNMAPAMQPVAFGEIGAHLSVPPCSLLTHEYLSTNCTRALDLYRAGPLGAQYDCALDPWHGYKSPFHACGGLASSVQLRNMGYSAVMVCFNALLYVLLQECTRDMTKFALSKISRGKGDTRTSSILVLTGLALGCVPLFFVYMLLSPVMLSSPDLVTLLTVAFAVNLGCWVLIGVLLNLEFVYAMVRWTVEYDVFVSYRVKSDGGLAHDVYRKLRREALRVYLDTECLKDGENWEDGFMRGLEQSSIYVLLFSRAGMECLATPACTSKCDNVLLELRLARELQARRGRERFKVYSLLLGDYTQGEAFHSAFDWWKATYPSESCPQVEAKLAAKLEKHDLGPVRTPGGVADNLDWLFKIQHCVVPAGPYDLVLDHATRKVADLAEQVKKAQMDAGGSFGDMLGMLREHLFPRRRGMPVAPAPDEAGGTGPQARTATASSDDDEVTEVAAVSAQ